MTYATASEVIPQDCIHLKSFQHGTSRGLDAHGTSGLAPISPLIHLNLRSVI